ncbi:hypothetical protein COCOBI_07-0370 [Coccomyxa sp. Obi]|nr:hypothetical protein COCOBI_07-0370 [Coccomyxa sp. Obi]
MTEQRMVVLTSSSGWEGSGVGKLQANPWHLASLEAGFKYNRKKEMHETTSAWTTLYMPREKHCIWSMSMKPEALQNVERDEQARSSLCKSFTLTVELSEDVVEGKFELFLDIQTATNDTPNKDKYEAEISFKIQSQTAEAEQPPDGEMKMQQKLIGLQLSDCRCTLKECTQEENNTDASRKTADLLTRMEASQKNQEEMHNLTQKFAKSNKIFDEVSNDINRGIGSDALLAKHKEALKVLDKELKQFVKER